ncbi:MAG TPA: class I SAM-dependent rRNA methyltransferase [Pirellulaceae bacterium]|nr:class I SAM-dependent rRNA methyltransferase [Pirellulaceae bacterium]
MLRPKRALPFYGRHPWVRDSAVERVEPMSIAGEHFLDLDGQTVDLVNEKGKFIARGFYNSQSRIRVRLYSWSPLEPLDEAFFRGRIEAAIELRRKIGYERGPLAPRADSDLAAGDNVRPASDIAIADSVLSRSERITTDNSLSRSERTTTEAAAAARLVFSEADGLSGLVVDRYGEHLVVQVTSLAIAQRVEMIVAILQDLLQPRGIVLRTEKSMAQIEGVGLAEGKVWGELAEGTLEIVEHGLRYRIDLHEGQKTGFYLDQRENRRAAAAYVRGGKVLDMFCYTGGFAMCAAALGGAADVLGIDTSKKALAQARANAALNGLANVRFETGDGFQTLDRLLGEEARFDAVILDPPKFARNQSGASQALMAYHRLNRAAIGLLPRGGILVTCSCSGGVSREDFLQMLSGVAQKSGRDIQVLDQRGAAPDHPVSATCLQTEYLKCLICRVI